MNNDDGIGLSTWALILFFGVVNVVVIAALFICLYPKVGAFGG